MLYNVSCINALVVYVGSQAILQLNNKTPIITHSAPMDVFHQVCSESPSPAFPGAIYTALVLVYSAGVYARAKAFLVLLL